MWKTFAGKGGKMESRNFGYIRVSSKDQNEARQVEAMLAAGIAERDIYLDKQSGKNFVREKYLILKNNLRKGDALFIKEISRLGRNKEMIEAEWRDITQNIGADIVVLDIPLLDTRNKNIAGLEKFISQLVLQILSWLAEEERTRSRKNQREGIDIALREGIKFGKPPIQIDWEKFKIVYDEWKEEKYTAVAAMNELGLKANTFYRRVAEYEGTLKNDKK
jgi:DNA invertase Pin-like site-specific DNA recombinase